jgi:hypothetical protein
MTAPDALDPYTARAIFTPAVQVANLTGLVSSLLEDIGRRCEEAGCSLIGHMW